MRAPWWKWEWDKVEGTVDFRRDISFFQFDRLIRWRRGWVTLYKFETDYTDSVCVEWRLFLPFNVNVGIEYDRSS